MNRNQTINFGGLMIQHKYNSRVKGNPQYFQIYLTDKELDSLYARIHTWQIRGLTNRQINEIIFNYTKQDFINLVAEHEEIERNNRNNS